MSLRGLCWQYHTYQCLSSSASGCRIQTSDKVILGVPSRLCSTAGSWELRTDSCEIKVVLLAAPTVHSNEVPPTPWLQSLGPPQGFPREKTEEVRRGQPCSGELALALGTARADGGQLPSHQTPPRELHHLGKPEIF